MNKLSKKNKEELKLFKIAIKKNFSFGNKNIIIIDSKKTNFKEFITIINNIILKNKADFMVNIMNEDEYIQKNKVNSRLLFSSFNSERINALVISNITKEVALTKYGDRFSFVFDFDEEEQTTEKEENIKSLLNRYNLKFSNEDNIALLKTLDGYTIERILLRAFAKAISEKRDYITSVDLCINENNLENSLRELKELIGLEEAKQTLLEIINYLKLCSNRKELPVFNMCFLGNPGTGKTTVAKLIGKIMSQSGILRPNAPFIIASRETLVGQYLGHSEEKTLENIKSAVGGILFIDEAYSLSPSCSRDFGKEVINVLVNQMDIHRNDICIIFSGYKEQTLKFLKTNPGLSSRVPFKIEFKDFNEKELLQIFNSIAYNNGFYFENGYEDILLQHFKQVKTELDFGNGRYVRNLFERAKIKQANRIFNESDNRYYLVKNEDLMNAIYSLKPIQEKKHVIGFETNLLSSS